METSEIMAVLESIGLRKNEIEIYLDLIKLGKSSARDISKRTKIHRPNVYDTVEKLIQKGIVTQSIEENRKVFYPCPPKNLLHYLKQKEKELQEIIPKIKETYNQPNEARKVTMAEGIQSFRVILEDLISINQPIFLYGIPEKAVNILGGFIHEFHRERIKKKIVMKHIYNKDAAKRIKELNQMEYTEARFLPSLFDSNTTTMVCGNKVLLIFWESPISTIIIENESIAKTYRNYFEILWEEARITYS